MSVKHSHVADACVLCHPLIRVCCVMSCHVMSCCALLPHPTEVPKTGLATPFKGGTVRDVALKVGQVCLGVVVGGAQQLAGDTVLSVCGWHCATVRLSIPTHSLTSSASRHCLLNPALLLSPSPPLSSSFPTPLYLYPTPAPRLSQLRRVAWTGAATMRVTSSSSCM